MTSDLRSARVHVRLLEGGDVPSRRREVVEALRRAGGMLRREVTQREPLNDERRWLLHQLAQREVCGFDACPSRLLARQHALTNPLPESKS